MCILFMFLTQFPTDLTSLFKNTIGKVANILPLNYHAESPEYFKERTVAESAPPSVLLGTLRNPNEPKSHLQLIEAASFFSNLKRNPLLYDKEAKIARKIIRKAYGMI